MTRVVQLGILLMIGGGCTTEKAGDTGGGSDTAGTDSDTGSAGALPLGFDVEAPAASARLSLVWSQVTETAVTLGDSLVEAPADAAHITLTCPTPDAAELAPLDPEHPTDLVGATYIPAVYDDGNGDGVHSPGEVWLSVSPFVVLYLQGGTEEEYTAMGMGDGCFAVQVDAKTAGGIVQDRDAIPLEDNLSPHDVTMGGTYAGDEDPAGMGLLLISGNAARGDDTVSPPIFDQPFVDPWSIAVSGPPPDDHFEGPKTGLRVAMEVPALYLEQDGISGYSEGDALRYGACDAGVEVTFLWLPPPTELLTALQDLSAHTPPGWGVYYAGNGPLAPVDPASWQSFVFEDSCTPAGWLPA